MDFEAYFVSRGLADPTSFFKDTMLDQPDTAIAVYEYTGFAGLPQISGVFRSVQVVSQAKSAADAKTKADALYASLLTEDGILNLTPERWAVLRPLQTPFKIKVDNFGRSYYGFNVRIITYSD